jgi:hypothetical protein
MYNLRIMMVIAAKSGHRDIVEHLLSIAQRENILHKFFISRGTINAPISRDDVEVFRKLIDVDPLCVNYDLEYGRYSLNRAMLQYRTAPENTLKILELLLKMAQIPISVMGRFHSYKGNISNAARNGHLEIVCLLIEHGADASTKYYHYRTPLDAAVVENKRDLVEGFNGFKGRESK